ncbi:hypothetical protein ACTXT7_010999 [Hymenolepis weldensis]
MFSVPSLYSIKPSASVEIPNPATAEDVCINVPEFIHDHKSGKFFEPSYNKHKYVFMVNLFKWVKKTKIWYLVRKLGPVEYERTLTEVQFRCLIFISGLQTKPFSPLRTRLLRLREENPKQQEMVRGVKMANLMCDSALIDFDAMPTHLVHKMSALAPQSAQFVAQPNSSILT